MMFIWNSGKWISKQQRDVISPLWEWLLSTRHELTSVGENKEKIEPLCTLGGNVYWHSHYQNSMKGPWKIENATAIWSAILLVGIDLKKKKKLTWKGIFTPVFIAALFTTVKTQKQPKCPSANRWMGKEAVVHVCDGIPLRHSQQYGWNLRALCWVKK